MSGLFRHIVLGCLSAFALSAASGAQAVVITFQATDLTDTVVGEDRWQYHYTVAGSFVVGGGFNVIFSPALYRKLENPAPSVNNDWLLGVDPIEPLLVDGLYRATVQVPNPSLADPFTLSFVWLGSGAPGSQPFEVFDESFFPPIATGQTQAEGQVPLPNTLALLGLGLLALRARKAAAKTN